MPYRDLGFLICLQLPLLSILRVIRYARNIPSLLPRARGLALHATTLFCPPSLQYVLHSTREVRLPHS